MRTNKRSLAQDLSMRCSHCGICCQETQMLLSEADIKCLQDMGFGRKGFVRRDRHGFVRLRNLQRYCVFYDIEKRRCRIYRHRPSGCRVYPVIYSQEEGIVADALCPMRKTISKMELKRKGKKLIELLEKIDNEATRNRNGANV